MSIREERIYPVFSRRRYDAAMPPDERHNVPLQPLTGDHGLAALLKTSKADVEEIKREAKPTRKGQKK